jgi:hypothetical protein
MINWGLGLVLLVALGVAAWGLWPFITGRDVAPWDEDDEGDDK